MQIEGRTADDLEYVGGGGLLLQGYAQLVQQPRVFDCDDGLGGEILYQIYLLVSERPDLFPVDGDHTSQRIVFEHRHKKKGTGFTNLGKRDERPKPAMYLGSVLMSAT